MEPVLAISFVHGAILGGLALGSLPIIIHLLNRRRFKTMEWAAMDFLLKAAVRNRRRVRLENLLLLALRVLLVCLLVVAVARPYTERDDPLAGLFGTEGATDRVILLDDSHSMRAGVGNRSAFDSAKQLLKTMVKRLYDERSGDRISVVLASEPRRGDERFTRVPAASARTARMLERLDGLRVSDGVLDLAAVVDSVLEAHEDRDTRLVLYVVSDFRRRDWQDSSGELQPSVREALGRLRERGELRLVDVGGPPIQNAGVVELEPEDRAVIAGVPATFVATLRNHGPGPVGNLSVTFQFGEQATVPVKVDSILQSGEEVQVRKEYTFREEGPVVLSARIPADVLPGDSVRRRVVSVRRTMRFLLVDGEPELEDFRGETDFLAAALAPPGPVGSGIQVDVVSEAAFSGRELTGYDGVFLCNVYRLPDDRLGLLEEFVAAGGGLVFFLGDQVDPRIYNNLFFGARDKAGKGLLPLRILDVEGSADDYVHLAAGAPDHPVLRFLRGLNPILFRTVAVRRWLRCDAPVGGDAEVLLRLTDADASPFLAEKEFHEGRVLQFTSAADLEWSNFPQSMLYLALLQEAARHVVRPDPASSTLLVSAPIEVAFDPPRMQRNASLLPPPELGGSPVRLTLSGAPGEGGLRFRYEGTTVAGTYLLRLVSPDGEEYALPFVCNVDPTEGDLHRAAASEVAAAFPGTRLERAGDEGLFAISESDRSEFWRALLYALLACAVLETFLAWKFGHHGRREAAPEGKQVFVR